MNERQGQKFSSGPSRFGPAQEERNKQQATTTTEKRPNKPEQATDRALGCHARIVLILVVRLLLIFGHVEIN